jgi:hypothetical protein
MAAAQAIALMAGAGTSGDEITIQCRPSKLNPAHKAREA